MIFKRLILLGTWQIVVFLHIFPHKLLPMFYLIFPGISSMYPTLIFNGDVYAVSHHNLLNPIIPYDLWISKFYFVLVDLNV